MSWFVYMLRCGDGTVYTGMTDDRERRLALHNSGHGAKYTRSRLPVRMIYSEQAVTRGAALSREAAIKRLTRAEKLELAAGSPSAEFNIPEGAAKIIAKLKAGGYEACAVGGCVRDTLMGLAPHDWDLASSALPEQVKACLAGQRIMETGVKHGTVTVLAEDGQYEVTTFRRDGRYSDGRRPDSVEFVPGLREDLARRDFTINAMAWSPESGVIDPFGGRMDIREKVIRCVGEPEKRFQEDALRILRAIRFASRLGFDIERDTERAMFEEKELLRGVSGERVREELVGILMGEGAGTLICRCRDVLAVLLPELPPPNYEQDNPWHIHDLLRHTAAVVDGAPKDAAVRLAALFHDMGKPLCRTVDEHGVAHYCGHAEVSAEICRRAMKYVLKFDNETTRKVVTLVERHDRPIAPEDKSVRRAINRMGMPLLSKLLELQRADAGAQAPERAEGRLADIAAAREIMMRLGAEECCFSQKELAVDGGDMISLGLSPGPQIGRMLKKLLDAVLDGELENDRESLLAAARKTIEEADDNEAIRDGKD